MQITLTQDEFKTAITCYLDKQGFNAEKYEIFVKLIAGRGETGNGNRAEVTLEPKILQNISLIETIPKEVNNIIEDTDKEKDINNTDNNEINTFTSPKRIPFAADGE